MCQFCEGVTLEGGKTSHYSLTFLWFYPLLSQTTVVSQVARQVWNVLFLQQHASCIYIYMCICIIYIYINVHIHTQPSRITTANHRQKKPQTRSLQRREEGREKGTAPGRCTLSCSYIKRHTGWRIQIQWKASYRWWIGTQETPKWYINPLSIGTSILSVWMNIRRFWLCEYYQNTPAIHLISS